MNRQTLISTLQSKIAKRKKAIAYCWDYYNNTNNVLMQHKHKASAHRFEDEQKFDKAILRELYSSGG